jgi:hypothetical protein
MFMVDIEWRSGGGIRLDGAVSPGGSMDAARE